MRVTTGETVLTGYMCYRKSFRKIVLFLICEYPLAAWNHSHPIVNCGNNNNSILPPLLKFMAE